LNLNQVYDSVNHLKYTYNNNNNFYFFLINRKVT
jgi:hypothetical protein